MATSTDVLKLDFGPEVPVTITPEARKRMARLAKVGLVPLLDAVRGWARTKPVKAVAVSVFADYEVPNWKELLIEVLLDIDDIDQVVQLSEELAVVEQDVLSRLIPRDRDAIDDNFAVHLLWGEDTLSV